MKRILFLTSNSLATNPRLVKELGACLAAGHKATVISFSFENWSKKINDELLNEFRGKAELVTLPGGRENKKAWFMASLISTISLAILPLRRKSVYLLSFSLFKRSWLLFEALGRLKQKFDVVIAHNPGAFAPASFFAKRRNIQLGIDIEDYHPGESNEPTHTKRMEALLKNVCASANVITASSPLILEHTAILSNEFPARCGVIKNVFSGSVQPTFVQLPMQPLKLIWFSQTVGLNRGIQDAILAMSLIKDFHIRLTVVGNCDGHTCQALSKLLTEKHHSLVFLSPIPEKHLIIECSHHHIGLALEPGFSINNSLALSNKLFTYLLAGNAIVASETKAQKQFISQYLNITGTTYPIGDCHRLAELIRYWRNSPLLLDEARTKAYNLAKNQLNWENESKTFLKLYHLTEEY